MYKDSRIYVAGHTGLLGSALVKKLKQQGYTNIITRTHNELDLTGQKQVDEFFRKEKPEYVFLAAGLTGGIVANQSSPVDFFHTNISIQNNVFQAAQDCGTRQLIFYASSCIYPKHSPQPIKEEYLFGGPLEETSLVYATAKIAGIVACKSYNQQFKTDRFIALVPNTMYGPNDNFDLQEAHVLSSLIRRFHEAKVSNKDRVTLWGSGKPRREFIFSEDVAEASLFALINAKRLQNTHYNIGTGIDYSIRELAKIVAKIVGFQGDIDWDKTRPDGSPRKLLESKKFLKVGWQPITTLENGLNTTYKWYLKNTLR